MTYSFTLNPLTPSLTRIISKLSDVVGVDILGNLSSEYVTQTADMIPGDWIKFAPEMEFFWLATSLEPAFMTPDMRVVPNCTYDDCPRDLDILLIGGPMPSHRPASADKFMKEAFPKTKVVMTTCIGSMWLASSGVLKGMKATTNRGFLSMAKKIHPEIDWQDQRWVVDNGGKLWTSGGAGAGKHCSESPYYQQLHILTCGSSL